MYSFEQKKKAIETFIGFDHSYADTIAKLGYPDRHTLYNWWRDYEKVGIVRPSKFERNPRYDLAMKRAAVDYYLEHGKNLARTMRAMGYPSKVILVSWIDELAPGQRKTQLYKTIVPPSLEKKIQAVVELEARQRSAKEIADKLGVSRYAPYRWRRKMLSRDNALADDNHERIFMGNNYDELPDDIEELRQIAEDLQLQIRKLELELDVRQATLEIIKKDPGTDPKRMTNREKALLIDSLRGKWKLCELLGAVDMAKSSYEYASSALSRPKSEEDIRIRGSITSAFEGSGGTYGYRRICAATGIAEWSVRKAMREEGLVAARYKRKRRYSSYAGEISEAPANMCLNDDGTHNFAADAPNELWVTDITEFRIKAGKVYLSPVIDCFDGMPISWSIATSPSAELANSSLVGACDQLAEGEHPRVHSDRGGHYRWPGWILICDENRLVRSMSRKGHSPDNSRMEGFFGRLKVEFFYGCDWSDVSLEEFMEMLDSYLMWYRDERLKSDLDYMSPRDYRKSLGLAA